jgi:hypothetical protein
MFGIPFILDEKGEDFCGRVVAALESIAKNIYLIRFQNHRPGRLTLLTIGQNNMALKFKVVLPTELTPDVINRELTVTINGETQVQNVAKETAEVGDFEGPDGAIVELSLVDVDDAGNRSDASVLTTSLTDTIAPAKPGDLAMVVTAEV